MRKNIITPLPPPRFLGAEVNVRLIFLASRSRLLWWCWLRGLKRPRTFKFTHHPGWIANDLESGMKPGFQLRQRILRHFVRKASGAFITHKGDDLLETSRHPLPVLIPRNHTLHRVPHKIPFQMHEPCWNEFDHREAQTML